MIAFSGSSTKCGYGEVDQLLALSSRRNVNSATLKGEGGGGGGGGDGDGGGGEGEGGGGEGE